MNSKIKVAAYCRVSTDMEDQLHSLSAQIKYFTEYISGHDGWDTVNGKMWREDGVCRTLKNDKYVGDLTQWKHYSTDFLSKRVVQNNGDNPDATLITITEHHEAIISREVWDLAQKQIHERGKLSREGRKYSKHYWYSSKVVCGKCGYTYNVGGRAREPKKPLHCVNRAKYGANPRVDANGAKVGCDNKAINEQVLSYCIK